MPEILDLMKYILFRKILTHVIMIVILLLIDFKDLE